MIHKESDGDRVIREESDDNEMSCKESDDDRMIREESDDDEMMVR